MQRAPSTTKRRQEEGKPIKQNLKPWIPSLEASAVRHFVDEMLPHRWIGAIAAIAINLVINF